MVEFFKKYKISAAIVGGVLVITTAFGQCSVKPDTGAIVEQVQSENK